MLGLPRALRAVAAPLATAVLLAACGATGQGSNADPEQVDATAPPTTGACRVLTPEDVEQPSNATETVDCAEPHTAQTFAVGELPREFDTVDYDDEELGVYAYQTCARLFMKHLGGDESTVMRTVVSWAWFRPSEKAWDRGARWWRCDVVGGGEQSKSYVDLPRSTKGMLAKRPDRWMVCVDGATVESEKIACDQPHTWRAVTTIKLGDPEDDYPGDEVVEHRTRQYCSKSVGAWLGYPVDFQYGYTWFHDGEWKAGNRRSVCWAKTDQ